MLVIRLRDGTQRKARGLGLDAVGCKGSTQCRTAAHCARESCAASKSARQRRARHRLGWKRRPGTHVQLAAQLAVSAQLDVHALVQRQADKVQRLPHGRLLVSHAARLAREAHALRLSAAGACGSRGEAAAARPALQAPWQHLRLPEEEGGAGGAARNWAG